MAERLLAQTRIEGMHGSLGRCDAGVHITGWLIHRGSNPIRGRCRQCASFGREVQPEVLSAGIIARRS